MQPVCTETTPVAVQRFAGFFLFNCFSFFAAREAAKKENSFLPAPAVPQKPHTPLKKCLIGDFFGLYVIEKEFDQEGESPENGVEGIQAYHFHARTYDPVVGMWLSPDPAAQFWNSYAYAGKGTNPISFVDPYGLELRLYFTPANDLGGYHVFVYSTVLELGKGRNGLFGITRDEGYETKYITDPETNGGRYIVITDLNGMTEQQAFDSVSHYPGWNEGDFFPFVDDCHTQMEEAFGYAGLHYPTAEEGNPGRFESANPFWEGVAEALAYVLYAPIRYGVLAGGEGIGIASPGGAEFRNSALLGGRPYLNIPKLTTIPETRTPFPGPNGPTVPTTTIPTTTTTIPTTTTTTRAGGGGGGC